MKYVGLLAVVLTAIFDQRYALPSASLHPKRMEAFCKKAHIKKREQKTYTGARKKRVPKNILGAYFSQWGITCRNGVTRKVSEIKKAYKKFLLYMGGWYKHVKEGWGERRS